MLNPPSGPPLTRGIKALIALAFLCIAVLLLLGVLFVLATIIYLYISQTQDLQPPDMEDSGRLAGVFHHVCHMHRCPPHNGGHFSRPSLPAPPSRRMGSRGRHIALSCR